MRKADLIETEDGSLSLLDPVSGELFHNRAGAITEAFKNYLEPSAAEFVLREKGVLRVVDSCFGLGYNTWVLLVNLAFELKLSGSVEIVAIERDSRVFSLAPDILSHPRLKALQQRLNWPAENGAASMMLTPSLDVRLELKLADLRNVVPHLTGDFDLVFHDPFSPKKSPELWTADLFSKYRKLLDARRGKVLTYSSATAVRGGFQEAGFLLGRTASVGGKWGGTAAWVEGAILSESHIQPLAEREVLKIASRTGIPYRDAGFADLRKDILDRREREKETRAG